MFATLDFCKNSIMHHAEKNKNFIYRLGRSVLEKYFGTNKYLLQITYIYLVGLELSTLTLDFVWVDFYTEI